MFNHDITIYNAYLDPATKMDVFKRTVVKGHWESEHGVSVSGVVLRDDNSVTVVIPLNTPDYVSPMGYNGTGWTLKKGDFMIKGVGQEITSFEDLKQTEKMVIDHIETVDYAFNDMLNNFTVKGK